MALQFTTTKEAATLHGVKVLVHGRAGAGKTTLIKTAPAPLIISAEAGLLSLGDVDIPTLVVSSIAELDEAYQFVAHSEHAKKFETICLDSISEIAEICLSGEKAKSKDPRKAYGEMQDQVMSRIRWFRDLSGRHVYFSAKQGRLTDQVTGVTVYGPSMPGQQLGPQLPYLFDEIFSLEVGKTQEGQEFRYLRTKTDVQYEAKDRSGMLEQFEEPDLTKVIEKILTKSSSTGEHNG